MLLHPTSALLKDLMMYWSGPAILEEPGAMGLPFLRIKNKKGEQREKRKTFKAETIKRLSPRLKCYCLAILERLEFKNFSGRSTMVADNTCQCSMAPPLWNPFRRPCWLELILSSDQNPALFREKQILRSTSHKNLQKQNNEDFFIQLLYAWLHLTNNNFPAPYL